METVFKHLSPILWTKNLNETISFFTTVLDFKAISHFPDFVSLCRDQVEIMFVVPKNPDDEGKGDTSSGAFFPKSTLTGSLYITVNNVDELWEKVRDKVKVESPLCDREYWMRDFSMLDNNGYEIVFGQAIPPGEPQKK